jgi:hypothetical protein
VLDVRIIVTDQLKKITDGNICGPFLFSMDVQLHVPPLLTRYFCVLRSLLTQLTFAVVSFKSKQLFFW